MNLINKFFKNKNKKIDIRDNLDEVIDIFNETKEMNWQNTCLIVNSKSKDIQTRELLKNKILSLRKIKGII